jgi:hypothetical protein
MMAKIDHKRKNSGIFSLKGLNVLSLRLKVFLGVLRGNKCKFFIFPALNFIFKNPDLGCFQTILDPDPQHQ